MPVSRHPSPGIFRPRSFSRGEDDNDLRHQELRHDEEGARLAGRGRAWPTPSTTTRRPASTAAGSRAGRSKVGWEALLNRPGTTFRKLPDADKEGLTEKKAIALMLAQPSMIKRPVLEAAGGKLLVGFKPDRL